MTFTKQKISAIILAIALMVNYFAPIFAFDDANTSTTDEGDGAFVCHDADCKRYGNGEKAQGLISKRVKWIKWVK